MKNRVLILLGDCPGYYVPLMHKLAESLVHNEIEVVIAATSPYYEKHKKVDFAAIGHTFYLSDFLNSDFDDVALDAVELDYWNAYPTYVRDYYFLGHHRNDWRTYKKVVLFYQEIFNKYKVDLVLSEPPSNAFFYIGFTQSKKSNAKFLGFLPARIPRHINVFNDIYGHHLLRNPDQTKSIDGVSAGPPDYMLLQNQLPLRGLGFTQLWQLIGYSQIKSIESGRTLAHQLRAFYKKYIWRKLRYRWVKLFRVFATDFDFEKKINVLFPLHLRPEASTSVLARYYENDIELIKNIAFSLPNDAQLIVKEHISAIGIRDLSFYKKVLSFPNTILLSAKYDLLQNMGKFDAAVVLTSTVGFEAIQLSIPVYLLGHTFYSDYPGITNIESFEQLEKCLRKLKKNNPKPNRRVMETYLESCFEGQFNYMSKAVLSAENVEKLMVPIKQMLCHKSADRYLGEP